jgi:anti-anti-sigma factor
MVEAKISAEVRALEDGVAVIDVGGQVTGYAEDVLAAAYDEAAATRPPLVALNLEDLEYMNSSGIGLLVTLLIRAQRSGTRLAAIGLSDHYREIFRLTRLDEAIEIYDDEADIPQAGAR